MTIILEQEKDEYSSIIIYDKYYEQLQDKKIKHVSSTKKNSICQYILIPECTTKQSDIVFTYKNVSLHQPCHSTLASMFHPQE